MGASKSDFFSKKENHIASVFRALAHPARIAIIEHLLKVDSCICGDIVSELPLAQSTISQHLRELKQADIIKGSIEGNSICYCLNMKTIETLTIYIQNLKANLENKSNCC